jgi:hypothetical protein
MVTVPVVMPVTTPAEEIVALAVLLLLHVPPAVVLVSDVAEPEQITVVPAMGVGTDAVTILAEPFMFFVQPVVALTATAV